MKHNLTERYELIIVVHSLTSLKYPIKIHLIVCVLAIVYFHRLSVIHLCSQIRTICKCECARVRMYVVYLQSYLVLVYSIGPQRQINVCSMIVWSAYKGQSNCSLCMRLFMSSRFLCSYCSTDYTVRNIPRRCLTYTLSKFINAYTRFSMFYFQVLLGRVYVITVIKKTLKDFLLSWRWFKIQWCLVK